MAFMRCVSTRRRIGVASLLVATAALVACGGDGESGKSPTGGASAGSGFAQVESAAKKEGRVVLYLSITGVDDKLKKAFREDYPNISLEIFRTGSAELLTRLDQEKDTGAAGADVTLLADKGWYQKNAGRLVAPTLSPAYQDLWTGSKYANSDGKFVLVDAAPLGVVYNTEVIANAKAKPIENYTDLLQPELKGLIGFTPAENAAATVQWWFGVSDALGGKDAFTKLAALGPRPYTSLVPLVEAVAAGEHAVGVYGSKAAALPLIAKGAPIKYAEPKPVAAGGHYVGVVDWAKNKNAAEVLRNWLLSAKGQIALSGDGTLYSPLPLSKLGAVPDTMQEAPEGLIVTDGLITSDQQKWLDEVWKPAIGKN
jgi:iron(III) transport system substrate-binding protein